MAGRQEPPAGVPAGGQGRPGRTPVGYQGRGGPRPGVPSRPATGRSAPDPADGYQAYEPYPSERPGPARQTGGGGGGRFIDYPRHGKHGWRRWVPSWKQNLSIFGLGVVLLILLFSILYATTDIPKQDQKVLAQTTIFYYADGKTEIGRLATQNRQNIQLKDLKAFQYNAVLAAEDRTFITNKGINPTSIVRAAWSNARGNQTQGGSTITQQYVKNAYAMQQNRNVTTKIREFFIALKITQSLKKEVILEQYLNTIYFGRGAYGIQAASQAYFHKDAKDLNVGQAAYLAGIINAPSRADEPDKKHPEELQRAIRRRDVVLDAMVTEGWLSKSDRDDKYAAFPKVYPSAQGSSLSGQKGFLVAMAQQEAVTRLTGEFGRPVTEEDVETGGYKIVTTFNQRLMNAGVAAVKKVLPASSTPARVKVGMAAIDPGTGAVRAIYGGKNWTDSQFNQATQARAEGGSTFKAFGLLAALDDGVSLRSRFRGTSPMEINGKRVDNFGGEQCYNCSLLEATKDSVNTVYVQLNKEVGPPKAQAAAEKAGLPKSANMEGNLVNVLGSANPHAIDMAAAYATFADEGTRHEPYTIKSISSIEDGKEHWNDEGKTGGKEVFDKDVIADLTYALEQPIQGGTGAYALALNRPAAGKTGTSSDNKSAWFVGYTPRLSVAVALYKTSKDGTRNVKMQPWGGFSAITGGSFPVRVWTEFMKVAMKPYPIEQFPPPVYGGDTIGIAPPPPRVTQQPTQQPTESPSAQPSQTESPQPTNPFGLPTIGLPGQTDQQPQDATDGQDG